MALNPSNSSNLEQLVLNGLNYHFNFRHSGTLALSPDSLPASLRQHNIEFEQLKRLLTVFLFVETAEH